MDFEEFCDNVLKTDPKIRFFGIYQNGNFFSKLQSGIESYLTKDETEQSLIDSIGRWKSRAKMEDKVGKAFFSLSKYEKFFRITLPLNNGLVLVTTTLDADILRIISEVEKIKNQFEWLFNVIIADDNRDMVDSLSILLGQKRIHVVAKAFNGKEAVDLYFSYKPDVLLLDMKMPDFDGSYAITEIQKKDPNAKIIVITAHLDESKKSKNTPVFIKPIEIDELVEAIEKLATS